MDLLLATVTSVSPLKVKVDGASTASVATSLDAGVTTLNQRVAVTYQGSSLFVLGVVGGASAPQAVQQTLPVLDTRNVNSPPSYYKRTVTWEFKTGTALGMPQTWYALHSGFVALQTIAGWEDNTGGPVMQIAYFKQPVTMRTENAAANVYSVRDPYVARNVASETNMRSARRVARTDGTDGWASWFLDPPVVDASVTAHINNDSGGLNNSYPAGFYETPPGTAGNPNTGDWFMVRIERHTNNNTNAYILQEATNFFTHRRYARQCLGGDPTFAASWTAWKESGGDTGWLSVKNLGFVAGFYQYAAHDTMGQEWHARYRKKNGVVYMNGLIAGPENNQAFSLPTGFAPTNGTAMFIVPCSGGFRRMDIRVDGAVIISNETSLGGNTNSWVNISCSFPIEG